MKASDIKEKALFNQLKNDESSVFYVAEIIGIGFYYESEYDEDDYYEKAYLIQYSTKMFNAYKIDSLEVLRSLIKKIQKVRAVIEIYDVEGGSKTIQKRDLQFKIKKVSYVMEDLL